MMMNINTNTEANQNFSRVARMVDANDSAVVLKKQCASLFNNGVLYCWKKELASNEDVMELSQLLIAKNMEAYKVLAKL